jgi:hypothetical protein
MHFGALWIGNTLPAIQQISLSSFIHYGHTLDLYVYDFSLEVPDGIVKKDASDILPESEIFLVSNSYAVFADLFRYNMIQKTGHTWTDCDVVCLSSNWDFDTDILAGIENNPERNLVVGSVLRLPQNSEILNYLIDKATGLDKTKIAWGDLGPELLTKAFDKFGLTDRALPMTAFAGVAPKDFMYFWDPSKLEYLLSFGEDTKAMTFYNQMIRWADMDTSSFPKGSPLDYFHKKFIK